MAVERVSQVVGETLVDAGASERVSQVAAEILGSAGATGNVRVSQTVAEPLISSGSTERISQIALEILCFGVVIPACPIPLFPDIQVWAGNQSVVVGREFSVHKHQIFATLKSTAFSGRESRMYQQLLAFWQFDLTFGRLREQTQNNPPWPNTTLKDLQAISQLFNWCAATRGSFYFDDRFDDSRLGQAIAIGDGFTMQFTMVRTLAPSTLNEGTVTEPVGAVNTNMPVTVYINGTPTSATNYTITGNQLTFKNPPANGAVITADFWFYYLCHFIEEQQKYSEFMKNLWQLGKCSFRSLIGVQC